MHRLPIALASLAFAFAASRGAEVSFNRDVRPILSDACFQCHGPDEAERKSGLRLDLRDAALKPAKSGSIAIVPGKPEESELLLRVRAHDADEKMPPPKSKKTIKPEQIELLRKWIAEGAEYQGHWAFLPVQKPAVPALPPRGEIPVKAIDAFVSARLAKEGLHLSAEASRETLIRRVTLDLTGLPPTEPEIDAFLADRSPGAYEKVVDRLLASPRYGEHMAAQWLDFARYADSNGFQSDATRDQSAWRDWVIGAFNRNLPFDRFTVEQLAGDLLPNPTRDQIVATAFHRNHRLNGEGGRIVEEWFAETVIDRVETTGLTWMGLTLGCSRCHDHKFDPISQKEFYQFFAYFNSIDETGVMDDFGGAAGTRMGGNSRPVLAIPTPEQEKRLAELNAAVAAAEAKIAEATKQLPALQSAWEKDFNARIAENIKTWIPLPARTVQSAGGATLTRQTDGSYLAGGMNAVNDTYEIEAPATPGEFTGLLLETFPDPSLPNQSLGRAPNGNFVLTGVEAEFTVPGVSDPIVAEFTRAEADFEQKGWEVGLIVRDKPKPGKGKPAAKASKNQSGWAIEGNDPAKRLPRRAIFVCNPITVPQGATLTIRLVHGSQHKDHQVGRFRLSTTGLPPATVKLDGAKIPDTLRAALNIEPAKRTPQQQAELAKFHRENTDNPAKRADTALAAAKKAVTEFNANIANVMVMKERAQPRDAFVLKRGEYDKPGDKVPRALPAFLPPLPEGAPNNRLGLAEWLVSGQHPLTARVWVNRAWERYFGTGLVKTSENLGSQSEWPSHPELLDWLASEFVRLKWDMKAMHRLLVSSATYRQSSRVTPELLAKDPENRLLSRGPRFRLQGEILRDQALALSGLLVEKIGGQSVKPYMPPAVWDETSVYGNMRNYKADTGEGLYRRTLYTIWKRTAAPPSMLLFDSPNREICTVKRSRTNTPLQALALLNEITYVEAARAFATRIITQGGPTPEARIAWAFRHCTGRQPAPEEVRILTTGLSSRLARYQQSPAEAAKLLAVGASKPPANIDPAELAAYTTTANVLLNLDETLMRD
jgi:hypothetical protein